MSDSVPNDVTQSKGATGPRVQRDGKARPKAPKLTLRDNGNGRTLDVDHDSPLVGFTLIMNAIGTTDRTFLDGLLRQIVTASNVGLRGDVSDANFILSVVESIEPRDELEAMLAAQMAVVHMATMTFAQRLARVETVPQQDSAERAFNKLARTFATQMEALKRYRTGGEQKVTVQHVTVHEGGQAIVGSVNATRPGGGG